MGLVNGGSCSISNKCGQNENEIQIQVDFFFLRIKDHDSFHPNLFFLHICLILSKKKKIEVNAFLGENGS